MRMCHTFIESIPMWKDVAYNILHEILFPPFVSQKVVIIADNIGLFDVSSVITLNYFNSLCSQNYENN